MRKVKEEKIDDLIIRANEIANILDREYFHTSVEIKNNDLRWNVYYKNLPHRTYYSYKNKPLLNSYDNDIADIYKLKEKFEILKNKESVEGIEEFLILAIPAERGLDKTRDLLSMLYMNTGIILFICAITNAIVMHNILFSILYLFATLVISFSFVKLSKKARKENEKTYKKMKERYVKYKIRKQGLYFVERLKV